jgi:NTP pyrophosphatase (non-canonical NTP hydrolase)
MGLYKDQGDPALALTEECAEVIQLITKMNRHNGNWNEVRPGQTSTRWEELVSEMNDVLYQWNRLNDLYNKYHDEPEPLDDSYKSL